MYPACLAKYARSWRLEQLAALAMIPSDTMMIPVLDLGLAYYGRTSRFQMPMSKDQSSVIAGLLQHSRCSLIYGLGGIGLPWVALQARSRLWARVATGDINFYRA